MGCKADKDMKSDLPCRHEHVLECRNCRLDFTVTYTDEAIQSILDRLKAIEAKLGAASQRESATREDAVATTGATELSPAAAPSVSAEEWRGRALALAHDGFKNAARACDLAAAVTEACEHELDTKRLGEIALAFVRGEKLPEVKS